MITLKQLLEQEEPEETLRKLDILYRAIDEAVENATSEKRLIDSMLMIKKEVDKLRTKLPNTLSHFILRFFPDYKKVTNTEKQILYSLGTMPEDLLFRVPSPRCSRKFSRFVDKLRSLAGLRVPKDCDFDVSHSRASSYSIEVALDSYRDFPYGQSLIIEVLYQSTNYIVFRCIGYYYVAKHS
jgi:hypothetical protein